MKQIALDELCNILGIENTIGNKTIEHICFRQKHLKPNSAYFTIISEGFNGYEFNHQKIKDLGCVVFTTKQIGNLPCIIVENPIKSLYKAAKHIRDKWENLKTVIVTGSAGKTSAKEMLYCTLQAYGETIRNSGSANSTREACRLVFNTDETIQNLVMELGLRRPNRPFTQGSKILSPDVVFITSIGHSHIENFESREHILEHKLSAADYLKPDGVLVLNGDNDVLYNTEYNHKTIFFGINNKNADYTAEDIRMTNDCIDFVAVSKDNTLRLPIHLNAVGEHNILNALGSIAIAKYFNIPNEPIQKGLAEYKPTGFRNNVVTGYKNNIIIADCFNATPESMKTAFETLKNIQCTGRKIAVLGHMMRLGNLSKELHEQTGHDLLEYGFDMVITYGAHSTYIYEVAKNSGMEAYKFYTKSDAIKFLKENVQENDAVLFKGVEKFNNFQDLYYGFIDPEYKFDTEYEGLLASELSCHSEAEAIYFGDENTCYTSKNIHKKVCVKDIIFMIIAISIIENSDLSDKVVISNYAASKFVQNTGVRFNPTNIFTVEDLLCATMLKSSYESAYALLEHTFGNFDNFTKYITDKFRDLGVENTYIEEYIPEQANKTYTTAYDMYLITKYALKNPTFVDLISRTQHTLNNLKSGKQTPLSTDNKLLVHETHVTYLDYFSDIAIGIKSEKIYNDKNELKGKNLVSCAKKGDEYVIGVILGSDEFYYCNTSYMDMKRILGQCLAKQ